MVIKICEYVCVCLCENVRVSVRECECVNGVWVQFVFLEFLKYTTNESVHICLYRLDEWVLVCKWNWLWFCSMQSWKMRAQQDICVHCIHGHFNLAKMVDSFFFFLEKSCERKHAAGHFSALILIRALININVYDHWLARDSKTLWNRFDKSLSFRYSISSYSCLSRLVLDSVLFYSQNRIPFWYIFNLRVCVMATR